MEKYGKQECHDSMQGIAWNSADHMVPCMELHRGLMKKNPGTEEKFWQAYLNVSDTDFPLISWIPKTSKFYDRLFSRATLNLGISCRGPTLVQQEAG